MGVKINQREYAWGDMNVIMLGRPVAKCVGIEYKVSQEKEVIHGAGYHAVGIQRGKISVDGTLTLLQSEVIALTDAAKMQGYDSLLDITVDIIINYTSETLIPSTDVIYRVEFTEDPREFKVDDMKMEVSLPFIALSAEFDKM